MIKLTSCDIKGGNQQPIWINVSHIISIETEEASRRAVLFLTEGAQVRVTESVDDIIGTMGYDEK